MLCVLSPLLWFWSPPAQSRVCCQFASWYCHYRSFMDLITLIVSGLCWHLTAPALAVKPELPAVGALTPDNKSGSPCPSMRSWGLMTELFLSWFFRFHIKCQILKVSSLIFPLLQCLLVPLPNLWFNYSPNFLTVFQSFTPMCNLLWVKDLCVSSILII